MDDTVDLQSMNARGESVRNIEREEVVLIEGGDADGDTRVLDEGDDLSLIHI